MAELTVTEGAGDAPAPAGAAAVVADTPSAAVIKAANQVVYATDSLGRRIGVKKLGPLDRMRLFKIIGGELAQNAPYLGYAVLAAAVTEFNGEPQTFPQTQRLLEHLVERLGDEGLEAAGKAMAEQYGIADEDGAVESAKN